VIKSPVNRKDRSGIIPILLQRCKSNLGPNSAEKKTIPHAPMRRNAIMTPLMALANGIF
jgi:hypothetical protein